MYIYKHNFRIWIQITDGNQEGNVLVLMKQSESFEQRLQHEMIAAIFPIPVERER